MKPSSFTHSRTERVGIMNLSHVVASVALAGSIGLIGSMAADASPRSQVNRSAQPPTAASLITAMNKAIATMHSVHLEITAEQSSPKVNETISQDSGYTSGSQHVSTGGEYADVLLTPQNAYLSGNSSGLSAFFALPPDDLALVGTKWIVVKNGAAQYKTFVNTIGYKNLFKNLVPTTKPVSVTDTTYHANSAYALTWQIKSGTATTKLVLYLPRSGKELPLAETATSGSTTEQSVLSQWNKKVVIRVPTNTIAITKLHPS